MSTMEKTMKRVQTILFVASAALLAAACADESGELSGRGKGGPGDGTGETPGGGTTPEALQCTEKPEGKSYVNFDTNKLEDTRVNENVGVNRARLKPYGVLAGEYQRVLGAVPASLAGSAGSFDEPPPRWYEEAAHSGISLNAFYGISFEGCLAYAKTQPDLAAAPTAESAKAQCTKLMRKAWSRSPSPEETGSCEKLAMEKLGTEANTQRRWAYVCASILSSSQFLTF